MPRLEIKVRNPQGEKVVYENTFLSVSKYREYLELQARMDDKEVAMSEAEKLDEQLRFIASIFEGLEVERLYDGLTMKELNKIVADVFMYLVGAEDDPKAGKA